MGHTAHFFYLLVIHIQILFIYSYVCLYKSLFVCGGGAKTDFAPPFTSGAYIIMYSYTLLKCRIHCNLYTWIKNIIEIVHERYMGWPLGFLYTGWPQKEERSILEAYHSWNSFKFVWPESLFNAKDNGTKIINFD